MLEEPLPISLANHHISTSVNRVSTGAIPINLAQSSEKSKDIVINVIDIQKGKLISEIRVCTGKKNSLKLPQKKMEKIMNTITYVFYDEKRHEIVTGHENGSIVLWN